MANGIRILQDAGFKTCLMPHARDEWRYLAGTDEDRAKDLQEAFFNAEFSAIICTRGGYGCSRLLPFLDFNQIATSRKLFVGYSDITTLHLAINQAGLATLHAPMVCCFNSERPEWVAQSWIRALSGDSSRPIEARVGECIVGGRVRGPVIGGCLSLLGDSLGTPNAFKGKDCIVLIEDVHEAAYRVDARLTHLMLAGAFEDVRGIVVGEMTGTDEKSEIPWREVVRERLEPLGVPMIFNYPFGHVPDPLSLPLGIEAELDADKGTLTYPA